MLFSKAQQAAMNLTANLMSDVKKSQEDGVEKGYGDDMGYEEKEVFYILKDCVLKVKVEVSTVSRAAVVS